jgi:RNA polymerase sigma factor (sigma-70 family)
MECFDELYRRHAESAFRVAMAVTGNRHDASDAVAEAFSKVLRAVPEGRLEDAGRFRPYLLAATRNAAIEVLRRAGRLAPADPAGAPEPASPVPGPPEELEAGENAGMVGVAFRSLPERWRSVLWLTEVEGMSPRQVGELLGLSANGAAQLAVRARAGLRQSYLQAHLRSEPVAQSCRAPVLLLGAYAAGGLSARDVAKADQHLAGCAACRARLAELAELGATLRRIAFPLPLKLAGLARAHFGLAGPGPVAVPAGGAPAVPPAGRTARVVRLARLAHRPLASASAGALAVGLAGGALAIFQIPGGSRGGFGPASPGSPGMWSASPSTSLARADLPPGPTASPATLLAPGQGSGAPSPGAAAPAPAASASGAGAVGSTPGGSAQEAPAPQPGPVAQASFGARPMSASLALGSQSSSVQATAGPVSASVGVEPTGAAAQLAVQAGQVSASVEAGPGSCTGVAVSQVAVSCTPPSSPSPVSVSATIGPPLSGAVGAVTTAAEAVTTGATGALGVTGSQLSSASGGATGS